MERIAQLLDDLEDALSMVPLLWERLRRGLLRVGLAAAIGVPIVELLASRWAIALAIVALAVSVGWLLAVVAGSAARMRRTRMSAKL